MYVCTLDALKDYSLRGATDILEHELRKDANSLSSDRKLNLETVTATMSLTVEPHLLPFSCFLICYFADINR